MNQKIIIYILIALMIRVIISCTCVPGIDTEKIITPSDLSHILFIHAQPDYEAIKVITEDGVLYKNLSYQGQGENNFFSYKDIKIGVSTITITNYQDSTIIFKSQLYLQKDSNYSFITYGKGNKVENLLLMDSIHKFSSNNAYVRLLNLSPDSPTCIFDLGDESDIHSEFLIKNGGYSRFYPIHTGKFTLTIRDSSKSQFILTVDTPLQFDAGMKYSVLLRGYLESDTLHPHAYSRNCMIIKTH
jgi:hypothetical protein